jgi:hypothetical protein
MAFLARHLQRRRSLLVVLAASACGGGQLAVSASGNDGGTPGSSVPPGAAPDATAPTPGSSPDGASPGGDDAGGGAPADAGPPLTSCAPLLADAGGASQWVYVNPAGKLAYKALPSGDTILDFSYAGYSGGGVALPSAPAQANVHASGGDDTAAIQAAIDQVSKLPLTNGLRGAVVLDPGPYQLAGSLTLAASGVVLRGAGSGAGGTTLNLTGSPRTVFTIGGAGKAQKGATAATITDPYVPSGASTFHVDNPSGLAVGQTVFIGRPVTAAWVAFMGMNTLVRNGMPQTWISAGAVIDTDRTITAIQGNAVTVDVPLSDSLDAKYVTPPGATVTPYTFPGRLSQIGLESLHVVAPGAVSAINQASFELLGMDAIEDSWVRDVGAEGFLNGLSIGGSAKRITLARTTFLHTAAVDGSAGYPADFGVDGQQVLFDRCGSDGDHVFSVVTQATEPGPNVILNMEAKGASTNLSPHQRWATGLLIDGLDSPTGGVQLMNRGTAGSGQGWAVGFGVVWNANVASMLIEQPPGSQNWAIGSTGTVEKASTGAIDSPGVRATPGSLYLAQLCERLGPQAVSAIGY